MLSPDVSLDVYIILLAQVVFLVVLVYWARWKNRQSHLGGGQ